MIRVIHGDMLEELPKLGGFHACVTDPPYGLEFMGKEWDTFAPPRTRYHGERADTRKNIGTDDTKPSSRHHVSYAMNRPTFRRCSTCGKREFSGSACRCDAPVWLYEQPDKPTRMLAYQEFCEQWARTVYDALLPGAHLVAFGGSRTHHRMACAIEDAGFEIRDSLTYLYDGGLSGPLLWCFGSGFPKSHNVTRALDDVRCLCDLHATSANHAPIPGADVLQSQVRRDGKAHDAARKDMRGLQQSVDPDHPFPGGAEPDVLASVQRGLDIQASAREASAGHTVDPVCGMREDVSPAAVASCESDELDLLLSMQRDEPGQGVGQARSQGPGGLDGRKSGVLHHEDDGAAQSGLEGRRDLPAAEGQLSWGALSEVSARSADDADGERLHHGASASDGPMGRASAATDGMRASPRSRSPKQRAGQSRTVAMQSDPQASGAWPRCERCDKPIIPPGLGTALKPAVEMICLARKPLAGTVAANVLAHGTGALNIDASRVASSEAVQQSAGCVGFGADRLDGYDKGTGRTYAPSARWPANVLHDGSPEVMAAFAAFGERTSGDLMPGHKRGSGVTSYDGGGGTIERAYGGDTGTAARFFFSAKADKGDRADSKHPTVKPVDLMRWLVQLVTPPGGTVLDPFAGSGTTGEAAMLLGLDATLIERDATHAADIRHRIARWAGGDLPLFAAPEHDDAYDRDMRDLFAVAAD